jgi:hypothetical protein
MGCGTLAGNSFVSAPITVKETNAIARAKKIEGRGWLLFLAWKIPARQEKALPPKSFPVFQCQQLVIKFNALAPVRRNGRAPMHVPIDPTS